MSKNKNDNSKFIYNLNDLLANSERYSQYTNKLFDDLAFPPGLYIKEHNIKPPIYLCTSNTVCIDCINDNLHSKLVSLANVAEVPSRKRQSSKRRSSRDKKTKKKR